eukprot:2531652-Prymnesium_polylepis.1
MLSARLAASARELRRDLLNNAAQAALQAREWEHAVESATAALDVIAEGDATSSATSRAKALFRRASAYVGRGNAADAAKARADLSVLLDLQPDNRAARSLLESDFFE